MDIWVLNIVLDKEPMPNKLFAKYSQTLNPITGLPRYVGNIAHMGFHVSLGEALSERTLQMGLRT